jgi:uncharacterized protein YlxW (UPF0749 family)
VKRSPENTSDGQPSRYDQCSWHKGNGMASNKGLTAVHGSLIFFVAVSVILAVVAYLNYSELKVETARADKTTQNLSKEQTAHRTLDQSVQDLKKKIDTTPQVGALDSDGDNTAG